MISIYYLPYSVEIDGTEISIRNKCEYHVILDIIEVLNDDELNEQEKIQCALYIFYGDELSKISNYEEAIKQMFIVINGGKEEAEPTAKPPIMNWQHDFPQLVSPISNVLGYDIRLPDKNTHWWTFLSGYMEIGECTFSTIVSIRNKKMKGKKLEDWEIEFYKNNRSMVDLPQKLTKEEQDFLDCDW